MRNNPFWLADLARKPTVHLRLGRGCGKTYAVLYTLDKLLEMNPNLRIEVRSRSKPDTANEVIEDWRKLHENQMS